MKRKTELSTSMTLSEFDNGYWYAEELKDFAKSIGILSAQKLRKDQLEDRIKQFLRTGKTESPAKRSISSTGIKDVDFGLSLDLPVKVYTNNKETKNFLAKSSQEMAPGLKRKSGARYRLNRWREEQLSKGIKITYRDLVQEYVQLSQTEEPFARIPSGRYINFLSDFLKSEKGATREQAIKAWKKLKTLDIPKDYGSWKKFRSGGK